jgi:hypothetical protein
MYTMRGNPSAQDKNANPPKQYGQHKKQDEQDGKVFFKKWTEKNGKLDINHFGPLESKWGKNRDHMEKMAASTMKILAGSSLTNVGPNIQKLVADEDKECEAFAKANPKKEKPKPKKPST